MCSDGQSAEGYRLAGVDYLHFYRQMDPLSEHMEIAVIPPMDDHVFADYARLLLPRAVGYSAALLNYFFRGKIDMVPDSDNSSQYVIKNDSDEAMFGTFRLYYDDTNGNRRSVLGADWHLSIAAKGTSSPVTFTVPGDTKEAGKYALVFSGTQGQEDGATIGKVLNLSPSFPFILKVKLNLRGASYLVFWDVDNDQLYKVYDKFTGLEIPQPMPESYLPKSNDINVMSSYIQTTQGSDGTVPNSFDLVFGDWSYILGNKKFSYDSTKYDYRDKHIDAIIGNKQICSQNNPDQLSSYTPELIYEEGAGTDNTWNCNELGENCYSEEFKYPALQHIKSHVIYTLVWDGTENGYLYNRKYQQCKDGCNKQGSYDSEIDFLSSYIKTEDISNDDEFDTNQYYGYSTGKTITLNEPCEPVEVVCWIGDSYTNPTKDPRCGLIYVLDYKVYANRNVRSSMAYDLISAKKLFFLPGNHVRSVYARQTFNINLIYGESTQRLEWGKYATTSAIDDTGNGRVSVYSPFENDVSIIDKYIKLSYNVEYNSGHSVPYSPHKITYFAQENTGLPIRYVLNNSALGYHGKRSVFFVNISMLDGFIGPRLKKSGQYDEFYNDWYTPFQQGFRASDWVNPTYPKREFFQKIYVQDNKSSDAYKWEYFTEINSEPIFSLFRSLPAWDATIKWPNENFVFSISFLNPQGTQ